MPFFLRQSLTVLALLLMVSAQVFGFQKGFLCDCGGTQEVTLADHCHGPHSLGCHEQTEPQQCDSSAEHDSGGDSRDHAAFVENLVANTVSGIHFAAPQPIFIDLAVFELWPVQLSALLSLPAATVEPWATRVPDRAWPHVLAHTLALRI